MQSTSTYPLQGKSISLLSLFLLSSAYQVLVPKGQDGSVEVSVKLKGYNEEVLAKNEIKDAVSKKRVIHWIDSLV